MDALGMFSQAVTGFTGGMMAQAEKSKAEDIAAEERAQKRKIEDLTLQREGERLEMARVRQAAELGYAEDTHRWEQAKQAEWEKFSSVRKTAADLEVEIKRAEADVAKANVDVVSSKDYGAAARARVELEAANARLSAAKNENEKSRRELLPPSEAIREEWAGSPVFQGEAGKKNLDEYVRFHESQRLRRDMMAADPRVFMAAKSMASRKSSSTGTEAGGEVGVGAETERLSRTLKNVQEIISAPAETPEQKKIQADALTNADLLQSRMNKILSMPDSDPTKGDMVDSAIALQNGIDTLWKRWTGADKLAEETKTGKSYGPFLPGPDWVEPLEKPSLARPAASLASPEATKAAVENATTKAEYIDAIKPSVLRYVESLGLPADKAKEKYEEILRKQSREFVVGKTVSSAPRKVWGGVKRLGSEAGEALRSLQLGR